MADGNVDIIQDPNDPNNQKNNNSSGTGVPSGIAPSAPQAPTGATGSAGGSGTSGQPSQGSTGRTGSGFVNIQNVLNANKQGGQQLGNTVGSGIQQAASDVGQQLGNTQNTFGAAATAGTLGSDTDKANVQNVLNNVNSYSGDNTASVNTTGQGPNASSTPTYAGLTQQNLSDFQKYIGGQYTGPQGTGITGMFDPIQQQAQQVQTLGNNVNTAGGQQQLLQQFVGQGQKQYGQGAQSLDQLLLGQNANPLQQARQSTVGLAGNVQNAETAAQQQAQAGQAQSQQFGNDISSQLKNMITAQQTQAQNLENNAQNSDTQTQANYNAIENILQSGNPTNAKGVISPAASASTAIPLMVQQGLINQQQANDLTNTINKGFLDPNIGTNAAYQQYLNNPNATYNTNPGGNNMSMTYQQAVDYGFIKPTYTSLDQSGIDLPTLLQNSLQEQTQGSTINQPGNGNIAGSSANLSSNAFMTPSQQAQMNALQQLSGQTPSITNAPTYTAAKNTFDYNNFLNNLNEQEQNHYVQPGTPAPSSSPSPGMTINPLTPYLPGVQVPSWVPQVTLPSFSGGGFHFYHGGKVPNSDGTEYSKLRNVLKK